MNQIERIMELADAYADKYADYVYPGNSSRDHIEAYNALRAAIDEALALPVQKPVAWLPNDAIDQLEAPRLVLTNVPLVTYAAENHTAIYTGPQPQREWVGLTEQEAAECWSSSTVRTWQAIEQRLKEKNT
jgi:hypothetical protein